MGNSKNKAPESEPIKKDNTTLNIIICNSDEEIKGMKFLETTGKSEPKEYIHKFYGWKFYDYGNQLDVTIRNHILKQLKDFCRKNIFQNILLIFDKESNNHDNPIKIMEEIIQNSEDLLFPPILIYISDSNDKNTSYYRNKLHNYILQENIEEGEEFDELNISSFLYETNTFYDRLINELWQYTIYYNQIPQMYLPMTQNDEKLELKVQKLPFTFNILMVGESGTGKSTFINIFSNKKIAYESDNGFIKTNKINEYLISFKQNEIENIINNNADTLNENQEDRQFNYKISDTLGFSLENKELEELIQYIKEYSEESIKIKDQIHCILYFLNENKHSRIYTGVIKKFFDYIYNKKIKVIFVINYNDGRSHLCKKKLKKNFKIGFSEVEYNFFFEKNDDNIIELNLKKYKGVRPFGINKLMKKLANFFKQFKVLNLDELRNKDAIEVLEKINKYPLYNDLKNIDDLCIKYISLAKKLVSFSIPIIIGISFIPIPGVDDVIAISIETGVIAAIGRTFGENMSNENIKRIFIDLNFSSPKRIALLVGKVILRISGVAVDAAKILPGIGTIIGGALSAGINITSLELTAKQAINYFCERFLDNLNSEGIISMCQEYNNNIDGFQYLENLFNFSENNSNIN
jgi:uncharacterized protein (DUF697 family)/ABC-type dipeptide/oligopeptide/nickel transport system ATPase component